MRYGRVEMCILIDASFELIGLVLFLVMLLEKNVMRKKCID